MQFNSQICTSQEQSERLLALGLKKETADMSLVENWDWSEEDGKYFTGEYFERPIDYVEGLRDKWIPAWSLHRLIELKQPNTIDNTIVVLSREQTYDKLIGMIAKSIKEGSFPKEYLV